MSPHLTHVSHNPHKSTDIPPVIFPPPDPGGGSGFNLLKADFENGVFSPPFWNPWGIGIDVRADTTPRATGKLLHIEYSNDVANGNTDSNLAVLPGTAQTGSPFILTLNQELWFKGDFYVDPAGRIDGTLPNLVLRKMFRFGNIDRTAFPSLETEFVCSGPFLQLFFVPIQPWLDPSAGGIFGCAGLLTVGAWHTVKMQMKLNSVFGVSDGIFNFWYDGVLQLSRTDMRWSLPEWIGVYDPANYRWDGFGVGYQMQSQTIQTSEFRNWDNISFATSEAAL